MHSELNHQANVRVVVKNQNTNVVDVIYGKCNQTVSMQCVTFNKEHVTIGESYGNNKIPTIAVALEHIDSASCYLPFITISYISDVRDTFVINRRYVGSIKKLHIHTARRISRSLKGISPQDSTRKSHIHWQGIELPTWKPVKYMQKNN